MDLSGCVSPETAHVVADYPYGFHERCSIRYWMERNKKGARFVSQTTNPRTGAWNKPKASTYCMFGAMVLDTVGHVTWEGIGGHSSAEQIASFAKKHGLGHGLDMFVRAKAAFAKQLATGAVYFTINGERCERSEKDVARLNAEAELLKEVVGS